RILSLHERHPTPTRRSSDLNAGTVNFSPGNYLYTSGNGTLTNASGGLWDFQNNTAFSVTGSWSFDNQAGATLRKSTTAGTLGFKVARTHACTLDTRAARLSP